MNLQDKFILFDNDFPIFDEYEFNNTDAFIKSKKIFDQISIAITEKNDPYYFFLHNKKELENFLNYIDNSK